MTAAGGWSWIPVPEEDRRPGDATFVDRPGGRIACRFRSGAGPAIVFCPGYGSDMDGTKALALDAARVKLLAG